MPQAISVEPLAQMLRSIALQKRTGILCIEQLGEKNAKQGEIYFEKGRLLRARCGQATGKAAIQHIYEWKQITCSFHGTSRPFPIATSVLTPSSEPVEEKPRAPLLPATIPQTENLSQTSELRVADHLKRMKSQPARAQAKQTHVLAARETEAITAANFQLATSPVRANQPLVLHGERLEEYTPQQPARTSRKVQRWTTHVAPAPREIPGRPPVTPQPGPLPREEVMPGRTAIFKARAMVATTQAIQCMERRERIIFILLDGRRTIQDIARLTHQIESEVEQILVHLTRSGYTQYIRG